MLKDATKVELKIRLVAGFRLDTCMTKLPQCVASPTTDSVPSYRRTIGTMYSISDCELNGRLTLAYDSAASVGEPMSRDTRVSRLLRWCLEGGN